MEISAVEMEKGKIGVLGRVVGGRSDSRGFGISGMG